MDLSSILQDFPKEGVPVRPDVIRDLRYRRDKKWESWVFMAPKIADACAKVLPRALLVVDNLFRTGFI